MEGPFTPEVVPTPPPAPSILSYAEPVAPRLPTTYYPGPAGEIGTTAENVGRLRLAQAIILSVGVILLIVVIYYYTRAPSSGDLAQKGWTVYLRKGCGACDAQVKHLAGFSSYVVYGPDGTVLENRAKGALVPYGTIKGFPHWHNSSTGEVRTGLQDAAALKVMASAP